MDGDFLCEYFAIPALVIVFRETLEATVLLAVLLQFLKRAGQVSSKLADPAPSLPSVTVGHTRTV